MCVPTGFTLHNTQKDSFNFVLSISGSSSAGGTRNEEIKVPSFSALIWIQSKRQSSRSWGTKGWETHRKSLKRINYLPV